VPAAGAATTREGSQRAAAIDWTDSHRVGGWVDGMTGACTNSLGNIQDPGQCCNTASWSTCCANADLHCNPLPLVRFCTHFGLPSPPRVCLPPSVDVLYGYCQSTASEHWRQTEYYRVFYYVHSYMNSTEYYRVFYYVHSYMNSTEYTGYSITYIVTWIQLSITGYSITYIVTWIQLSITGYSITLHEFYHNEVCFYTSMTVDY